VSYEVDLSMTRGFDIGTDILVAIGTTGRSPLIRCGDPVDITTTVPFSMTRGGAQFIVAIIAGARSTSSTIPTTPLR